MAVFAWVAAGIALPTLSYRKGRPTSLVVRGGSPPRRASRAPAARRCVRYSSMLLMRVWCGSVPSLYFMSKRDRPSARTVAHLCRDRFGRTDAQRAVRPGLSFKWSRVTGGHPCSAGIAESSPRSVGRVPLAPALRRRHMTGECAPTGSAGLPSCASVRWNRSTYGANRRELPPMIPSISGRPRRAGRTTDSGVPPTPTHVRSGRPFSTGGYRRRSAATALSRPGTALQPPEPRTARAAPRTARCTPQVDPNNGNYFVNDPPRSITLVRPFDSAPSVENRWKTRTGSSVLRTVTADPRRTARSAPRSRRVRLWARDKAKSARRCSTTPNKKARSVSASTASRRRAEASVRAAAADCLVEGDVADVSSPSSIDSVIGKRRTNRWVSRASRRVSGCARHPNSWGRAAAFAHCFR